ncbi:MAG TPA: hypothetical protein VHU19_10560 [Pyrinomonadaceae bacterium]|jgi:hypothetical protein|nr:hypothetical protein [Pyrinomonadaceae bacterium]
MDKTGSPPRGWERFAPELTLGEARARFFALGGLGEDGGYSDAWVRLKLWRIPLAFPNTEGRRRAVRLHDVHHILTGYPTDWRGEFEIAAWEIATGIGGRWEAWLLDLLGFACGLVIFPRSVYRAFLRGRRSANLYSTEWDEAILARRVGEVRRQLRLNGEEVMPTLEDEAAFIVWSAASLLTYLAAIGVALLPPFVTLAIWWIYLAP